MFIGHLPAGYLCSRWLASRLTQSTVRFRRLLLVGMSCSLLPDLDLVYFYTIDDRQHLHHSYWTHIPFCWLVVFGALLPLALIYRRALPYLVMFAAAVTLHLLLDTMSGGIRWLYPVANTSISMVNVPARYSWWVANFLLHWTVAVEVLLVCWAMVAWRRSANCGMLSGHGRRDQHSAAASAELPATTRP